MDLDHLRALAAQLGGVEWAWDDGTLIELDHESPVGVQCSLAAGSPAAPFIAAADPQTVLQLVAIAKAAKEYQRGMFRPGSADLTEAWTALCAALAGVQDDK